MPSSIQSRFAIQILFDACGKFGMFASSQRQCRPTASRAQLLVPQINIYTASTVFGCVIKRCSIYPHVDAAKTIGACTVIKQSHFALLRAPSADGHQPIEWSTL